jgi:hypothetical protein
VGVAHTNFGNTEDRIMKVILKADVKSLAKRRVVNTMRWICKKFPFPRGLAVKQTLLQ